MTSFSTHWNASIKPRKQRKYRYTAPLHIKAKFVHVHLSKELAKKYHTRAIQVRRGDRVKIMRGSFKKQEGKVERVDIKRSVIFVDKVELTKREGSIVKIPLQPSNVLIIELVTDDKRRMAGTGTNTKPAVPAVGGKKKGPPAQSVKSGKDS